MRIEVSPPHQRSLRRKGAAVLAAGLLAGTAAACASATAAGAGSNGTGSNGATGATGTGPGGAGASNPSAPSTSPAGGGAGTTPPAALLARATSEGRLVSITGYRTENGGKTLLVYHTGVNGGCNNYSAVSSESGTAVWVGIVRLTHKLGTVCPMYITTAHLPVAVALSSPLGARVVLDASNSERVNLQPTQSPTPGGTDNPGGSVNPGGPMIR